ncbi:uncharacterized protein LOC143187104 [Calliopsis andreniformis]|uniref:uncharacterized protein LOC143187104 n=1 Tax=Calliopsis andreniformis TaxID=337506 RepID=UPI003FCC6137
MDQRCNLKRSNNFSRQKWHRRRNHKAPRVMFPRNSSRQFTERKCDRTGGLREERDPKASKELSIRIPTRPSGIRKVEVSILGQTLWVCRAKLRENIDTTLADRRNRVECQLTSPLSAPLSSVYGLSLLVVRRHRRAVIDVALPMFVPAREPVARVAGIILGAVEVTVPFFENGTFTCVIAHVI